MTLPKIPTRTDAFVVCDCGGTMSIVTVAPIAEKPGYMRNVYQCLSCGAKAGFDVAKKAKS